MKPCLCKLIGGKKKKCHFSFFMPLYISWISCSIKNTVNFGFSQKHLL